MQGGAWGEFNVIERSQWTDREPGPGVPERMGGHVMPSGEMAPLSTSLGAGDGVYVHQFAYPGASDSAVLVHEDAPALFRGLAALVKAAYERAVAEKGTFTIALSGGSLLKALGTLADVDGIDWTKWWVLWADERVVPLDSADSNYRGAKEAFLDRVPIPADQVLTLDPTLAPAQAAMMYEARMRALGAEILPKSPSDPTLPRVDLVLLGIGPDGHVASLFPNHPLTSATEGWVLAITDSPKPPPERITLSLPLINAASEVAIVAAGKSKAEVIQRLLEVQSLPGALPAQLVRPADGKLTVFLDRESAADLRPDSWDVPSAHPRSDVPKPPKAKKKPAKKKAP